MGFHTNPQSSCSGQTQSVSQFQSHLHGIKAQPFPFHEDTFVQDHPYAQQLQLSLAYLHYYPQQTLFDQHPPQFLQLALHHRHQYHRYWSLALALHLAQNHLHLPQLHRQLSLLDPHQDLHQPQDHRFPRRRFPCF